MAEIEKTPTLGLNKPPKGYFDWDVPLNENWDKLDFLGAGQLPLLTLMLFDHRLEGDEALGWAMQGSVLDGDEYTSVWEKLKTARDRAAQVTTEFKEETYTYFKDATSGWVFLDSANYNKAFENLGDSLGFVLSDVDGVKTIILPKREVYLKTSLTDANVFGAESLPNIKGNATVLWTNSATTTGCFAATEGSDSKDQGDGNRQPRLCFDASKSSEIYQDGAKVNTDHTTVFIYYKVGNTIVNQEQIDLGNLTSQVDDLATNKANTDFSNVSSNIDYVVESDSNYIKFKSGKLIQWQNLASGTGKARVVNLIKPYANTSYSVMVTVGNINSGSPAYITMNVTSRTTTNFTTGVGGGTCEISWLAIGQGA